MKWARLMLPLTTLCISACGVLLGIETDLSIPPADASVDVMEAGPDRVDSGVDASIDADPEAGTRRPPEGPYVYRVTTGGDFLGGVVPPGQSTTYVPTVMGSVAYEGTACFVMTLDFRENYTEAFHFCIEGADFVLKNETHNQMFAQGGATTNTQYDCTGTNAIYFTTTPTPADKRIYDCFGNEIGSADDKTAFHVRGTYSYDGGGTQAVGSDVYPLRLFYDDVTVTKKADFTQQYGNSQTHWHFKADDGVLVHFERTVDSTYRYATTVHYKEHVVMDLEVWPGSPDAGADAAADSD